MSVGPTSFAQNMIRERQLGEWLFATPEIPTFESSHRQISFTNTCIEKTKKTNWPIIELKVAAA